MNAIRRREGAIDKDGNQLGIGKAEQGLSTLRPEPRPQVDGQKTPAAPGGAVTPPNGQIEPESAKEQKGSVAPADPRAASLVEMAGKPIANPGRSALLKPVEKLTEGEMKDMIASAQGDYRGWRSGDPLKAHTYEKVQDWHVATHGAFGPLFRSGDDDKSPKVEGGVLQETLNAIGIQHHDDWEPLKVDNWIGPKTTAAFGKVLKNEDADGLTTAFGRGLGLL